MKYNPEKHYRRSIRLKEYDYSQAGMYFITVCSSNRECLFGEIVDGEMRLNEFGIVVQECWDEIPRHFPNAELDQFIVMPNHMHGIIIIPYSVGARHGSTWLTTGASPLQQSPHKPHGTKAKSLGAIVGSFKSATTKGINQTRGTPGVPLWQRNYHEHVIRNEESLDEIREYISGNPMRWAEDEENPKKQQPSFFKRFF